MCHETDALPLRKSGFYQRERDAGIFHRRKHFLVGAGDSLFCSLSLWVWVLRAAAPVEEAVYWRPHFPEVSRFCGAGLHEAVPGPARSTTLWARHTLDSNRAHFIYGLPNMVATISDSLENLVFENREGIDLTATAARTHITRNRTYIRLARAYTVSIKGGISLFIEFSILSMCQ